MAPLSPTVLAVDRQVRLVRRRRNLFALQRAVSVGLAAGSVAAAAIVVLALAMSSPRGFGAGAVVAVAVAGLIAATAARRAHHAWLAPETAPPWIDAAAGLEGRVTTLVELHRRGVRADEAFLLPVLEAENAARLDAWRPDRLLAGELPVVPACAALLGAAVLGLALVLAPRLEPPAPDLLLVETTAGTPARIAGAGGHRRGPRIGQPVGAARAPEAPEDRSAEEAGLASALQDRLRRALWGERWERVRAAAARGEPARGRSLARAPAGVRSAPGASSADAVEDAPPEAAAGAAAARDPARSAPRAAADGGGAADSQPGGGAGAGTDPDLYGEAAAPGLDDGGSFALAIAARVRSLRLGPRRPEGVAPPASPDARPALAARSRREAAIHKPVVPAAWEDVVRRVFSHPAPAAAGGEAAP